MRVYGVLLWAFLVYVAWLLQFIPYIPLLRLR